MRVIFRAEFQGPKKFSAINRIGCDLSSLKMDVDVFRKGDKWLAKVARVVASPFKLTPEPTHGCMKDAVEACFEKKLSPWVLCDAQDGMPIDPDYVEENPQGDFSMREVTHCGSRDPKHAAPTPRGPNYFIAACGVEAHAHLILSFRAPHPPLCKECRKEWAKTPENEKVRKMSVFCLVASVVCAGLSLACATSNAWNSAWYLLAWSWIFWKLIKEFA